MTDLDKRIDELKQRFYDAFNNNARLCDFVPLMDEQEALILEMQAELAAEDKLLRDICKDYEGLAQAAEANSLYKTAKDARETMAHITAILNQTNEVLCQD